MDLGVSMWFAILLGIGTMVTCQMTTETDVSSVVTSTSTARVTSPPTVETMTTNEKVVVMTTSTTKPTSTTMSSSSTTTFQTTPSTTTETTSPQTSTEWQDMDDMESEKLVSFVVAEIQKLKVEHKELDGCQELNLSSVLSGKKLNGKPIKYSVTLKVQPQIKNTPECLKQNSTMTNMHPEICEADVTEGDHGDSDGKTLLRSTCLQVEELQD